MDYNYLAAVVIAVVCMFAIIVSRQWFFTGFRAWISNIRYKGNAGAIFYRSTGSDFTPPLFVDLRTDKYVDGKKIVIYNRDMFTEGRFMGLWFCFKDADDDKTSIGIHKIQTDSAGIPLTISFEHKILDKDGKEQIIQLVQPVITELKTSVSIHPESMKAAAYAIALTQVVKDFVEKNKTLLLVAGAAAICAAAAAYFGYANNQALYSVCRDGIAQVGGQIADLQLNLTGGA